MHVGRSMYRPATRFVLRLVPILVVGLATSASIMGVATTTAAAGNGAVSVVGTGGGTATTVNLRDAATYPRFQPSAAAVARYAAYQRSHPAERSAAPATAEAPPMAPQAQAGPDAVPSVNRSFDSITQNQGTGCQVTCRPSVNAASSAIHVVELVNTFIQVHIRSGALACGGITLNQLLRTSDLLLEPKIQYDMDTKHFSFIMSVFPANPSQPPALWVAASDTENGCGTYRVFRLSFSNTSSFPPGTWLAHGSLGQDTHALLISVRSIHADSFITHSVFGLPKSTVYAGGQLSFNTFDVESEVAAVTNAGQPMVTSPASYFVGSVRRVGYLLYRLTNSGGPGATLTLQARIDAPFDSPQRGAVQPGTTIRLAPTFGEIFSAPFYDGRRVWFTHEVQALGNATVLYGNIDTVTNGVNFAFLKRSSTSFDVQPSLAVGVTPTGPRVYFSWVFTDPSVGIAASLIISGLSPGQPILTMFGGNVYTIGSVTLGTSNGVLFGGYSSTAIDPRQTNGGCALTAQQYFAPDGSWKTLLAQLGSCPLQD
jgi:hypothetical protein